MRSERVQSDTTQGARRPCHRCGWKADLHKMSRRGNKSLGIRRAFRWLCDDCCDDLVVYRAEVDRTDVTLEKQKVQVDRRIVA